MNLKKWSKKMIYNFVDLEIYNIVVYDIEYPLFFLNINY